MKRFFLSVCFATFLGAGLVSCNDEAAEITPDKNLSPQYANHHDGAKPRTEGPTRP